MSRQLPGGLLLLLLAAFLPGNAFAARSTHWQRGENSLQLSGNAAKALQWMYHGLSSSRNDETDEPAIIAIKYDVPPSMHDDFMDEWLKLQDQTHKEKGLMVYDLAKTTGDNVFFWAYGEWERMENYIEHFKSDYTQDFLDFLDDRDIIWELFPLKNVTDNAAAKRGNTTSGGVNRRGTNDYDPRDEASHVVIQYHVPPSVMHDFMDVWTDMAERTWDEKDNVVYSLRKVANMNHHFIAYGSWESLDAFLDHFTSKHARKLREFLAENDIVWYLEPVMKLGNEPEKQ